MRIAGSAPAVTPNTTPPLPPRCEKLLALSRAITCLLPEGAQGAVILNRCKDLSVVSVAPGCAKVVNLS